MLQITVSLQQQTFAQATAASTYPVPRYSHHVSPRALPATGTSSHAIASLGWPFGPLYPAGLLPFCLVSSGPTTLSLSSTSSHRDHTTHFPKPASRDVPYRTYVPRLRLCTSTLCNSQTHLPSGRRPMLPLDISRPAQRQDHAVDQADQRLYASARGPGRLLTLLCAPARFGERSLASMGVAVAVAASNSSSLPSLSSTARADVSMLCNTNYLQLSVH
ncbi:hypothetical protein BGZ60DRAFT_162710 [Tricladium varicosporioides]|nr:hypothetical protein BGZ60DRAFT_162710 [Hymenoscyphus varicosporioides]